MTRSLNSILTGKCRDILNEPWQKRTGLVVPSTETVQMAGGACEFKATMLYADLADSTGLATIYTPTVAAKVVKSFLGCATTLIRRNGGNVRSFDGDRVMGIFNGKTPNTNAVKCALQINFAVEYIFKPLVMDKFKSLVKGGFSIRHGVGVDTSQVMAVKAGIRDNNDLVWVGRAPNAAARLSSKRHGDFRTYITADVYSAMNDEVKLSEGENMWHAYKWQEVPTLDRYYASQYWWRIT